MTIILKKMNEILKKRINNIPYRITRIGNGANDAYNEGVRYGAEWMLNNQWISVEEALPPYDESVLVIDKTNLHNEDCGVYFNHRSDSKDAKIYDNGFCDLFGKGGEVLYWMPIPKLNKNIKQIK